MNICGLLVHAVPGRLADARAALDATDGVDVHAAQPDGRMVVTVEDTPGRRADQIIMDLHQIPGVVSVTLSYHHFEPAIADNMAGATDARPAELSTGALK